MVIAGHVSREAKRTALEAIAAQPLQAVIAKSLGASTATTRYIATLAGVLRTVTPYPDHFVFLSDPAFLGNSKTSVADMNNETPTPAKPERIFPVLAAIAPIAYGPANAPRFPTELIKAIPAAAENPVRNSLGIDQKGP